MSEVRFTRVPKEKYNVLIPLKTKARALDRKPVLSPDSPKVCRLVRSEPNPAAVQNPWNIRADPRDRLTIGQAALAAGLTWGEFVFYEINPTGIVDIVHENGHALATEFLRNPKKITVQVDQWENFKNLVKHPTPQNFDRVIQQYDLDHDGSPGFTKPEFKDYHASHLAQSLGINDDESKAIVSSAGSMAQEIPAFGGYIAGFMLRKRVPAVGYAMMASSMLNHFSISSYPANAAAMPFELLFPSATKFGNDWAQFALYTTTLPDLTAEIFTASLPIVALALYAGGRAAERRAGAEQALDRLLAKKIIAPQVLDETRERYPRRVALENAKHDCDRLFEQARYGERTQDHGKTVKKVRREQRKFRKFLIKKFQKNLKQEIRLAPRQKAFSTGKAIEQTRRYYQGKYRKDKVGTALEIAAISAGVGSGLLEAASLAGHRLASALFSLSIHDAADGIGLFQRETWPAVALLFAGLSAHRAFANMKDKTLSATVKTLRVARNISSILASTGTLTPMGLPLVLVGLSGVAATTAGQLAYLKIRNSQGAKPAGLAKITIRYNESL